MSEVTVVRNDSEHRYEGWVEGVLAGFAEFQLTDELVVFPHTEVKESFEGRGVASAIAQFALDDVKAEGVRMVLPLCPFIKGWIERHREYIPLVYGATEAKVGD